MRLLSLILTGTMLLSGCKKDSPSAPSQVVLEEPARNSECTPVQSSSGNSNTVRFGWQSAANTDVYELRVTNLLTGTVQTKSTSNTTETLSLQKGTPFSWVVVSKNSQTITDVSSESWSFYNPGSQTSYVPFPAEIIAPKPGSTVFGDTNNEIELQWSGSDIEDDIESYEIYFSTESPPEALIASPNADEVSLTVTTVPNTVYYWRVITNDAEGNASDTGILDFKAN